MDRKAQTAAARAARWKNHVPTERVSLRLPVSLLTRAREHPGTLSEVMHEALRSHLDAVEELDRDGARR